MTFLWTVHNGGYRVIDGMLVPRDGTRGFRGYAPLHKYTGLFLNFAETPLTEPGVIAFAKRYGLLGLKAREEPQELSTVWLAQIQAMKTCVTDWRQLGEQWTLAGQKRLTDEINKQLNASLWSHMFGRAALAGHFKSPMGDMADMMVPPAMQLFWLSPEGRSELGIMPTNLLSAIWLQFAAAVVKKSQFRLCPNCKGWFELSPDKRRADAQYCSEYCRIRAYQGRVKEALRLHRSGKPADKIARTLGTELKIVKRWIAKGK